MNQGKSDEQEDFECPYCGEEFGSENYKGTHVSKEHIDTDEDIPRVPRSSSKKNNIAEDKWDSGDE